MNSCKAIQQRGVELTFLRVGSEGIVDPDEVTRAIRPETVLISVMHANNELGTIQPIPEIARIAAEHDIYFHSDAVQSAGKIPLSVEELGVDLLSLSRAQDSRTAGRRRPLRPQRNAAAGAALRRPS